MDKTTKQQLEELFTYHCFTITQTGESHTISFIIKNEAIVPVILADGIEMKLNQYISFALNAAHENDADAIVLLGEQFMVKGKKDDASIQKVLSGDILPSEHPDKEEYLVLSYMTAEGETHLLFGKVKTDIVGTRYVSNQQWIHNAATSVLVPWK